MAEDEAKTAALSPEAAARQAADRLVARLVRELEDAKAVVIRLQHELDGSAVGCTADLVEVARREAMAKHNSDQDSASTLNVKEFTELVREMREHDGASARD